MKATGIVRRVDQLGRIVLPKELRKTLNIEEKDSIEIYVDGENVIFKKYEPGCTFCSSVEELIIYNDKNICKSCMKEIEELQ